MNRLIIIGNGFDLAHGLKTRYSDFMNFYILKIINTLYTKNSYSDNCVSIRTHDIPYHLPAYMEHTLKNALPIYYRLLEHGQIILESKQLLKKTLKNIEDSNWVDIELEFYNCIKEQRKQIPETLPEFTPAIVDLNNQLAELKDNLTSYLRDREDETDLEIKENYIEEFCNPLTEDDFIDQVAIADNEIQSYFFLDFNYTTTLDDYVQQCRDRTQKPTTHIKIHGGLESQNVIFGYGDEFDEKYKELEKIGNDEILKNIKSYQYLLSKDYTNLIRFIMGNEFQVLICGHSCGLSDKTLLNQIFTNPNCKSIKLFRYKRGNDSSDYMEKVYSIGRIINDNVMLRNKVLPFESSITMR